MITTSYFPSVLRGAHRWLLAVLRLVTVAAVLILVWPGAQPAAADVSLSTRWTGTGRYALVSGGVGLTNGPNEFTLTVPSTVVQAYLYWAGKELATGDGDDTLTLTVDPLGAAMVYDITADVTYGPEFWEGPNVHYTYVEDVTAVVLNGTHTYAIEGFDSLKEAYGAGIIVVYEDAALPTTLIEIKDGLDSLYEGFNPPQGPNSETVCNTFPASALDRTMDFVFLAGGVNVAGEERPNELWTQTGQGTPPTGDIIDGAASQVLDHVTDPYLFDAHNGPQFDVLLGSDTVSNGVDIPANDTYNCFQVESVDDVTDGSGNLLSGASMTWMALATALPLEEQPELASLGDFVWEDTDQDGVQDAGETGVSGVTVTLYTGAGALVGSTTTAGDGSYLFTDLDAGDYYVVFSDLPSGYQFTTANAGSDDALDSDANATTGQTASITLGVGDVNLTLDAGIYQPEQALASLGDTVWLDTDRDGVQDAGEAGVSGVTVTLYTGAGAFVADTTTNTSGFYAFLNLDAGDYYVVFSNLPGGYEFTAANAGSDDALDSDANATTGQTATTTLEAGENDPTWDAGLIVPRTPPDDDDPDPSEVCLEIIGIEQIEAGQTAGFTIRVRNPTGGVLSGVTVTQTLNSAVFAAILGVDPSGGTATISGMTLTVTIGTLGPDDVITIIVTVEARADLAGVVRDPQLFDVPNSALFICGIESPPADPVSQSVPPPAQPPVQAAVGLEGVTSLPATGYAPQDATGRSRSADLAWIGYAVLALTLLGAVVLTLRRGR